MRIGNRDIGPGHPVFVIAEVSANHQGDIEKARGIIRAAAVAGADAIKLQTFNPHDLAARRGGANRFAPAPWSALTLLDLYLCAQTPWAWHAELFAFARSLGLAAFSSAFSVEAVVFLKDIGADAIKVSAFESGQADILHAVTDSLMPAIVSVPLGAPAWHLELIGAIRSVALLHCVSAYPSRCEAMGLRWGFNRLRQGARPVGLSDHSCCETTSVAAVALGASIIEVHLMLDDSAYDTPPLDAGHSWRPHGFAKLVHAIRHTEATL